MCVVSCLNVALQYVEFSIVLNNRSPRSFIVILFNETIDNTGRFVKFNFVRASFDISHECDGLFFSENTTCVAFFFFVETCFRYLQQLGYK